MLLAAILPPANLPGSPTVGAVQWIEGVVTGTLGTAIGVIAIAGVGYQLLTGNLDWRRGAKVVLGCFILFGAPQIVNGLLGVVRGEGASVPTREASPLRSPPKMPPGFDPYAGASVPNPQR